MHTARHARRLLLLGVLASLAGCGTPAPSAPGGDTVDLGRPPVADPGAGDTRTLDHDLPGHAQREQPTRRLVDAERIPGHRGSRAHHSHDSRAVGRQVRPGVKLTMSGTSGWPEASKEAIADQTISLLSLATAGPRRGAPD